MKLEFFENLFFYFSVCLYYKFNCYLKNRTIGVKLFAGYVMIKIINKNNVRNEVSSKF